MTDIDPNTVDPEQRFRLRVPDVAFQVIDGEAILIDFERGTYYSARGTGCEILKLVDGGHSVGEIAEDLAGRSGVPLGMVTARVVDYIERLLREELVMLDTTRESSPPLGTSQRRTTVDGNGRHESLVLGEAELVKYTDLADLLLLDPIHDVDDKGWPPHAEGGPAAQPGE